MESIINILPEFVANQIAAGEVVNRPASAVKELLENAVDAGATEIELHIQDAGRTLVQVVDNGCGMSPEDAERCFLPHATSKLSTADDLHRIRTMGFRGEALASIAAVAQVELQTRPKDREIGTKICLEGGRIRQVESCACPPGSCFKIQNIYFNTPARRQFLKSDEVEYRYIEEEFNRVALAQPGIGFQLYRNNRKIYHLESSNLSRRIVQLMGKAYQSRIVKVSETIPGLKLTGYICTPDYSVKGRSKQYIFVNRRYIRHAGLANAVEKAYQGLLPEGKSPAFFLHIETDPASIDVNIHPTKTEIRFRDEKLLYGVLLSAAKHALGVNQMRNVLDFESAEALPYEHRPQNYIPPTPQTGLHPGYNPFTNPRPAASPDSGRPTDRIRTDTGGRLSSQEYRDAYAESFALMQESMQVQEKPVQLILDCCAEAAADTDLNETPDGNRPERSVPEAGADPADPKPRKEAALPQAVRIFQIFDSYIVTPLKSGLAVIDQEAASERVIYNDYILKKEGNMPSQSTLFPQTAEFSTANAELLQEVKSDLNALGWSIEWIGANAFLINAMPQGIQESRAREILENILDSYAYNLLHTKTGRQENIAMAVARQLAVKKGTALSQEEILYLANRLFSGPEPEISPSGQRILRILTESELTGFFTRNGLQAEPVGKQA